MHDNNFDDLPEAEVAEGRKGISVVWLLPLVAVLIGAWLVYKTFSETGPTITIQFNTAEGVEAQKTKVKYLEVEVGTVTKVEIAGEEQAHVILTVEMEAGTGPYLTDKTRFWVVRPRVGAGGISGIGTLLSGAYIGVDPSSKGKRQRHFVGLEEPPNILATAPGTRFLLKAAASDLSPGAPVLFRKIKVGEVTKAQLAEDHSRVDLEIFVQAPHDAFVTTGTRFWDVSGLEVDLGADGVNVRVASVASLISGGVAFDAWEPGERAPAGTEFTLFENRKQSEEREITVTERYVLHFEGSVRGLNRGAPVEYRGIRIGTVKDIQFYSDMEQIRTFIAVLIDLEPQRVPVYPDNVPPPQAGEVDRMAEWVKRGLRARIQTGNLLTGSKFVEFDIFPDAEPAEIFYYAGVPVLPTVPGELEGLTDSMARILAKVEDLPIEEIGRNLEATTAGTRRLVNSPKVERILTNADKTATNISAASEGVRPLLAASTRAAEQAESTLASFESVVSEDGPMGSELMRTLEELRGAARSLRVMADYLERHPEALLKGKRAD